MNINLHIEQLILEGVPLSLSQRPLVLAAVEAELGRLMGEGGLASNLQVGGTVPQIHAGTIQLSSGRNPQQLGHQIAHAVYQGIGAQTSTMTPPNR